MSPFAAAASSLLSSSSLMTTTTTSSSNSAPTLPPRPAVVKGGQKKKRDTNTTTTNGNGNGNGNGSRSKRILIIYTGGTMGMKPQKNGSLDVVPGFFTEQMLQDPDMQHEDLPDFDIYEYAILRDSACMGPGDWTHMATDVETFYFDYDGFVICHGTDTMAYSASALSYMLENLGKPVIFTGSQIPLSQVYTDAKRNLIISMLFASNQEFNEVCIFFGNKLLRGCRSSKVHSFDLNAFASPNFPPLATVGVNLDVASNLTLPPPRKPLTVHKEMDANIIVIRLVPGFEDEALFAIVNGSKNLHGMILQIYGTGNAPSTRSGLLNAVKLANQRGIVVMALTQCFRGGVLLEKYSVGLALRDAGVVSGHDLTVEAAATKLAYLFARTKDPEQVKHLLSVDLRGESSCDSRYNKNIQPKPDLGLSKL